jgi:hypothetical protein
MIRTRLTWVIVGAVVALLIAAGVDALRSSDRESSAPTTTASTTTVGRRAGSTLPRCTREQVAVSIEIRKGVATIVVRHVGANPCDLRYRRFRLTIRDRAGNVIGQWGGARFGGDFSPGSEQTFSLPAVWHCDRRGPFLALATVGPYGARRSKLSRSEITCAREG